MFFDIFSKPVYKLPPIAPKYAKNGGQECEVAIDWAAMNAVSIERLTDEEGYEITSIGYMLSPSDINEWHVYCSRSLHSQLVQQFVDYMNKKYERTCDGDETTSN